MWNQMLLCSQKEIIPAWGILGCATEGGLGVSKGRGGEAATDVHFIEHTSTSEEHKLATDP